LGVKKQNILYLYLERSELYPLNLKDLDTLLDTFFELVGYDKNQKYFLFLDEIQVVD
jgi:predicted AAA+ superfamily ATPase